MGPVNSLSSISNSGVDSSIPTSKKYSKMDCVKLVFKSILTATAIGTASMAASVYLPNKYHALTAISTFAVLVLGFMFGKNSSRERVVEENCIPASDENINEDQKEIQSLDTDKKSINPKLFDFLKQESVVLGKPLMITGGVEQKSEMNHVLRNKPTSPSTPKMKFDINKIKSGTTSPLSAFFVLNK